MRTFLEKIHEKSPEARKTIAMSISSIVTVLIILVWVSVTDFSLQPSASAVALEDISEESQVASPLAGIKRDMTSLKNNFKEFMNIRATYENDMSGNLEVVDTPTVTPASDIEFSFEETDEDGEVKARETFSPTTYPY